MPLDLLLEPIGVGATTEPQEAGFIIAGFVSLPLDTVLLFVTTAFEDFPPLVGGRAALVRDFVTGSAFFSGDPPFGVNTCLGEFLVMRAAESIGGFFRTLIIAFGVLATRVSSLRSEDLWPEFSFIIERCL